MRYRLDVKRAYTSSWRCIAIYIPSYTVINTYSHCHGSLQKSFLKSNTCELVRGYDGFEIIESIPQTTAIPGNEGGHYSTALAPPPELKSRIARLNIHQSFVGLRTISSQSILFYFPMEVSGYLFRDPCQSWPLNTSAFGLLGESLRVLLIL
ncbi:hypothetical protein TNCV_1929311 [Trichonephila clavipes]|nr:hypothetical protein TNCV_1929311 [Trichonephila clavipes]